MPAPTIYFPRNVEYRIGFEEGRQWNTSTSLSPHGRAQRRKRWLAPKRTMKAIVYPTTLKGDIINLPGYGDNDPGTGNPELTPEDIWGVKFIPFLNEVAGRFNPFYIFNPKRRFLYAVDLGPINLPGDLPFVFPFRGPGSAVTYNVQPADIIGIGLAPGFVSLAPGDFTTDTNGPGLETRLMSTAAPSGSYTSMIVTANAYERIPAVMTSDADDFQFDWAAAAQYSELVFDLEEDFG